MSGSDVARAGGAAGPVPRVQESDGSAPLEEAVPLSVVFDSAPVGLALTDIDGRLTQVNAAFCRTVGHSAERLIGRDFLSITHPDDRELNRGLRERLLSGELPSFDLEKRYVTGDGRIVEARVDVALVPDARGRPAYFVAQVQDLTDRRRTERQFRLILDNSTDWITRHAPDGSYLYVSPACRELLGYEPEEILGRDPYDFFHPDDVDRMHEAHARLLAAGGPVTITYRIRRRDGSYVWCESTTRSRFDPETGELSEFQVGTRDVSERVAAEERFRTAFHLAPIGMTLTDLDGRFVSVNRALAEMVGRPREELEGIRFGELTHPDDVSGNERALGQLAAGEIDSYRTEKRYLHADGDEIWVELSSALVRDSRGDPLHLLSQMQDISERKHAEGELRRAEERFRRAFEGAPIGMGIVSLDRRWLQVNRALCDIMGYSEEELLALNVLDMTHPDDLGADAEHIRELLAGEVTSYRWEKRYIHKRGHTVWTYLGVSLVRDEQGEPLHFVAQVEDITDRKRLAAEALDNARRYVREHEVAETFQRALLPERLPDIPSVELAVRYHPAAEDAAVGGDFYDVFELGDDAWGLVIGDVVGKGAAAAALTSLARHTIRAAALRDRDPREVLIALNDAIASERSDEIFCTVVYARLKRTAAGVRLVMASGGHPLPLIVRAGGPVEEVGEPGTLLGPFGDVEVRTTEAELRPGDALILYTDGVPEARTSDGLFGRERLLELVGSCAGTRAAAMAGRIEREALQAQDGDPRDDIALLVARLETGSEERGDGDLLAAGDDLTEPFGFSLRLAGGPLAPSAARAAIERVEATLDERQRFVVSLLVSELVTNAVLHAPADASDWVELRVSMAPDRLHVLVRDRGPGFSPMLRTAREDEESGRGLHLVDQLADRWGVSREGTSVWFEMAA